MRAPDDIRPWGGVVVVFILGVLWSDFDWGGRLVLFAALAALNQLAGWQYTKRHDEIRR